MMVARQIVDMRLVGAGELAGMRALRENGGQLLSYPTSQTGHPI